MRKILITLTLTAFVAAGVAVPASAGQETKKANIVKTAQGAGQFKTLVKLVKKAGRAKTLSGRGPYTVFAPTDAAFAKVPKSTLDGLMSDRAELRSVLLYHVVSGRVPARKVTKLRSAETLNGARVRIRVRDGKVFINGAKVVTPDVKASNGVIHAVNRVLIPPTD